MNFKKSSSFSESLLLYFLFQNMVPYFRSHRHFTTQKKHEENSVLRDEAQIYTSGHFFYQFQRITSSVWNDGALWG